MSRTDSAQEAVLLVLLLEACKTADAMREALKAAAHLMQDCTCQKKRRQESLAAVGLANAAIDRLHRLNAAIIQLVPEATEGEIVQ